ncbi:MAG TPA: UPF0175 family protein [Chitinophagales bacterium]|nr:UPF0175 family protein [Chitinophagales bacterium]
MLLELPDSVLQAFSNDENKLKMELAIMLFEKEIFTLAQAATFAGVHRMSFQKVLAERKIPIHYDIEDYEEDLRTIEYLDNLRKNDHSK